MEQNAFQQQAKASNPAISSEVSLGQTLQAGPPLEGAPMPNPVEAPSGEKPNTPTEQGGTTASSAMHKQPDKSPPAGRSGLPRARVKFPTAKRPLEEAQKPNAKKQQTKLNNPASADPPLAEDESIVHDSEEDMLAEEQPDLVKPPGQRAPPAQGEHNPKDGTDDVVMSQEGPLPIAARLEQIVQEFNSTGLVGLNQKSNLVPPTALKQRAIFHLECGVETQEGVCTETFLKQSHLQKHLMESHQLDEEETHQALSLSASLNAESNRLNAARLILKYGLTDGEQPKWGTAPFPAVITREQRDLKGKTYRFANLLRRDKGKPLKLTAFVAANHWHCHGRSVQRPSGHGPHYLRATGCGRQPQRGQAHTDLR